MAVHALEEDRPAVEEDLSVARLELTDAETDRAPVDHDRREIRLLVRPKLGVLQHTRLLADALDLNLDRAGLVVERAHEDLRLLFDKLHPVIEPAVEIEVVVGTRQFHARPLHDIVNGREKLVLARRKRSDRNLQPRIWIRMQSEIPAVERELRPNAHAVHDQHRVLHRRLNRERAPIAARAALQVPLRLDVPATRHRHDVRRREIGPDLFENLPFLKAERPGPVEVESIGKRHERRQRGNSKKYVLHEADYSKRPHPAKYSLVYVGNGLVGLCPSP